MFTIREYTPEDKEQIRQIIKAVISGGDTYVFALDSPKEEVHRYWCGEDKGPSIFGKSRF